MGFLTLALHTRIQPSSSPLDPVVPSFRALSGRLKFTVRRHQFNKDSLPQTLACSAGGKRRGCTRRRRRQSASSSRLSSFTHLTLDSLGPPQGEARRKDLPLSETGSYLRLTDSVRGMSAGGRRRGCYCRVLEQLQGPTGGRGPMSEVPLYGRQPASFR